jgi:hypothetical protein
MARALKLTGVTFTLPNLPNLFDFSFLAPNVVGWWSAEQQMTVNGSNQVTNWVDLTGNGNNLSNATPASSLVLIPGALNGLPGAKQLDATHGYWVAAAGNPAFSFTPSTPFAMAIVFVKGPPGGQFEVTFGNGVITASFVGWHLTCGTNPGPFQMYMQSSVGLMTAKSTTIPQPGSAYAVLVTYDGSGHNTGIQIYVNGVAETMTPISDTVTGVMTQGPFCMGTSGVSNVAAINTFCEVAVLNIKPNATQINQIFTYFLQKWGV